MPTPTEVNLGYGVISPIYRSKAKKWIFLKISIFWTSGFYGNLNFEEYQMLKDQENSVKALKRFLTLKVKSPQEKEMKYTLAFHAEGKKEFTIDYLV